MYNGLISNNQNFSAMGLWQFFDDLSFRFQVAAPTDPSQAANGIQSGRGAAEAATTPGPTSRPRQLPLPVPPRRRPRRRRQLQAEAALLNVITGRRRRPPRHRPSRPLPSWADLFPVRPFSMSFKRYQSYFLPLCFGLFSTAVI